MHSVAPTLDGVKAVQAFHETLYAEHLEEISCLYDTRKSLINDEFATTTVDWRNIGSFEQRLDAHIDALDLGGDAARELCIEEAREGDPGRLWGTLVLLCRQALDDAIIQVLDGRMGENAAGTLDAVCDALRIAVSGPWQKKVVQTLLRGDEAFWPVVATMAVHHSLPVKKWLIKVVAQSQSVDLLLPAIGAIGRLRIPEAALYLGHLMQHEEPRVRQAAAVCLLRVGDGGCIAACKKVADTEGWAWVPLALGGGPRVARGLVARASRVSLTGDHVLALGLMGYSGAVDVLIAQLEHETLGAQAALALNLLTGAALYENVSIPERPRRDELFPQEIEQLDQGERATPQGKQTQVVTQKRLSQASAQWKDWWDDHRSSFDSTIRYRGGQPYGPSCLLENIQAPASPRIIRTYASFELAIRYNVDFGFEATSFVRQQQRALQQCFDWVVRTESQFRTGAWYFAGRVVGEHN